MTTDDDRALAKVGSRMNDEQRSKLLAAMEVVTLSPGQPLAREGEPLDSLYVVAAGKLALSLVAAGKELALGELGASEMLGELAVLEPTVASVDARAGGPTRLLRLSHTALGTLRDGDAKLASLLLRALIEELSGRVRNCSTVLEQGEAAGKLRLAKDPENTSWLARTFGRLFGTRSEAS